MFSPIKNVLQHKINTQKLKPANCSHTYASQTKQYNGAGRWEGKPTLTFPATMHNRL